MAGSGLNGATGAADAAEGGQGPVLDRALAGRFARVALENIQPSRRPEPVARLVLGRAGTLAPREQAALARQARRAHLSAGLPHAAAGDYAGTHWLASFATLALTEGAEEPRE